MANNQYVNKVEFGNQTVMDISDTTAEESDVVSGKTFYKANGERSQGSAVIPDISNCYQTTDTAETTIDDADYFPFYDTSATAKRKTLWSNIKSVLNEVFFKRSEQAVLGAKNRLLPLVLANIKAANSGGTWDGNTYSYRGITFACATDSSGYVEKITISGTATGNIAFWLSSSSGSARQYMNGLLLSGIKNGGTYTYFQVLVNTNTSTSYAAQTNNDTLVQNIPNDSGTITHRIWINSGANISTIFEPMLRLASDPDNTYAPYSMTNKELTDGLAGKQDALTLPLSTSNGGTGNATGYIRTGKKSGSNASTGTTIEGNNNTATAQYAHAEGSSNSASGNSAHVEGSLNYAVGASSHAEGSYNRADGAQSHVQGSRCEADGDYSHTGGYYLYAGYQSQTVVGEYNDNKASTLFEVGNGTSTNARSNALEVYLDGHINVNGDIQKNGLDALETVVATSYANNGTVTFSGVDDTVGGTHMYSVAFNITSSSTQKAPYAELQSISGEGTSSMTLTYKTNADNGSSSNKNASLIRKIF